MAQRKPERRPDRRQALLNSIDLRLERLPAQEEALRLALEPYGRSFSLARWSADFDSGDVDAINRIHPVTGGFESIVNNLVEASTAGCKLVGVPPATGKRSGLLRHISPTVDAEALRSEIQLLLRHHRDIVRAFVAWLGQQGIQIQAASK